MSTSESLSSRIPTVSIACSHLNNPQHWHDRAEEARLEAAQLTDAQSKQLMLDVAAHYEKLAGRAEERATTPQLK